MKYKVGDIVRTNGTTRPLGVVIKIEYGDNEFPYKVRDKDGEFWYSEDMLEPIKTYEQGLNDAWELVIKLYDMKYVELGKIFGIWDSFYEIIRNCTPQQALAKLKAYEKAQKIEVGDVVETTDLVDVFRGIVLDDDGLDCYIVMDENGSVNATRKTDVRKTGKHIDITGILGQIREV